MGDSRRGNAGKGRKRGVPNKATASIKAAFVEAFEQRGGVKALVKWAQKEPTEFYKLAAKLIPTEIHGKVKSYMVVRFVRDERA